jgi:type I restriction enzyme S subunit
MELDTCLAAPDDWQRVPIENVCVKFTSGGTPSRQRPEFYQDGIVPWIKTKELLDVILQDAEEWITQEAIENSSAKRLPRNTVLMAMYGATVGQLGILGREMACNQACAAMVADDAKCDYRFLYYLLLANRRQIVSMATGAAQQNLSGVQIKGWKIALPEREEQRAIAHILGTLDDKIELNRRRNQTLEAMARALFKDWFVDFGPVRAKMEGRARQDGARSGQPRTPQASDLPWPGAQAGAGAQGEPYLPPDLWQLFPDRLDDEGKPEGWESARLDDALVLQRGFDLPASARTHGTYPVMAASGINGYHDKHMVKGPGITTGRSGVLGRVFLIHSDFWPLNTSLWVKEFKRVSPYYAFELLRSLDFEMFNAGSAVPTLNRNHVHNLPITLPPRQLIDVFDGQVIPMRTAQQKNEDECEFLAHLRDTLLPKLISGELRIADAETFMEERAQ